VKRWREAKRQHGLKAVTIWLTAEEELRLKDLALQWHCSPSAVVQRALAQGSSATPLQYSSPPDTLLIRELIREELAAMQVTPTSVTVGATVIPTDIVSHKTSPEAAFAHASVAEPGHSRVTELTPQRKGGRPRTRIGQQILAVLADHPEGLSAEELRVYLKAEKRIDDTLQLRIDTL
jgi:hypothetical protein